MSIFASLPASLSEMMSPPAPWMSALMSTTYASYLLAWTPTVPPLSAAASMIWSQVTGWVMSSPAASARDLRYQSTWVLAHCGKA